MARRQRADIPKPTPVGDHWEEPAVKAAIRKSAPALRGRLDAYDHQLHMDQFYGALATAHADDYVNHQTGIGDPYQDKSLGGHAGDRKSTRLNSSHLGISYA